MSRGPPISNIRKRVCRNGKRMSGRTTRKGVDEPTERPLYDGGINEIGELDQEPIAPDLMRPLFSAIPGSRSPHR